MMPDDLLPRFVDDADIFVETGTHRGDAIQAALDAGYHKIYSVDAAAFCYGWASHRFKDLNTQVHLEFGDSRPFMVKMARERLSPCVFWLDAHWCGGDGEMDGYDAELNQPAPLLDELRILADATTRTHVLLIDDVRMMRQQDPVFPELAHVIGAVLDINPDYQLSYADSPVAPGDILIAQVPS